MTKDLIDYQRQRKQQFTSNLRDLIEKFNKDTGLWIDSIDVSNTIRLSTDGKTENIFTGLYVKACL